MKHSERKKSNRIVILCEGDTEVIAVKHFIRQWEEDRLKEIGLDQHDLRGKIDDIFQRVPLYRKDTRIIGVFTLIDLYGTDQVKHEGDDDLDTKVKRVKDWLRDGCDDGFENYFYPHVCVHETEAWFLAEGICLAQRLKNSNIKPDSQAELKNFTNNPSKRVNDLFKKHRNGDGYHKINDGTSLFKCLNFKPIYDSCSYFRAFYDELVTVGNDAASQS